MLDVCHQLPCELSADSDAAQREKPAKSSICSRSYSKKNFTAHFFWKWHFWKCNSWEYQNHKMLGRLHQSPPTEPFRWGTYTEGAMKKIKKNIHFNIFLNFKHTVLCWGWCGLGQFNKNNNLLCRHTCKMWCSCSKWAISLEKLRTQNSSLLKVVWAI